MFYFCGVKKIALSLIMVVYMTVSSGMAMEIHFCMGERTGSGFYTSSNDTCGRCGMKEKKGGCCSDEQKFIKLSEDHNTSPSHYIGALAFHLLPATRHANIESFTWYTASYGRQSFADSGPPLYIVNRVFRI